MPEAIRVLIVDDHGVVRQGLRRFLELQPDIAVVGEADNGRGIVELVRTSKADVVLMDIVMPDVDGIDAIRALHNQSATTRVLVLSSFADDAQVFAAVQAGAAGYLLKDVRPDDLAAAIRQVHAGRTVLHPDAAARLVERTQEPAARFTGRERDVLKLLTEGFANKEIARRLLISEKTVKTHVSNILQKLGVQDRTQAAVIAVRQRLVD
ncbi:MAG: hypothetical protein QOK05_1603 [Chloroflexota bacterium]|jgi:NarL family two-component system response regulator LiaR|nr:hypothetical protein [Chloroflexota bacterium]